MKKSRIFMTLGALTLVMTGVLATKANKKFSQYTGDFYTSTNHTHVLTASSCIAFVTPSDITTVNVGGTLTTLAYNNVKLDGISGGSYIPLYY